VEALTAEMRREFVNAKEFSDLKTSLEKGNTSKNEWLRPIVTGLVVGIFLIIAQHLWPVAAAVAGHP
jgi:hypothetical protein